MRRRSPSLAPRPSDTATAGTGNDRSRFAALRMSPAGRRFVSERLWSAHGLVDRLRRRLAVTAPTILRSRLEPVRPAGEGERKLLRAALDLLPPEIDDRDGDWILVADVHAPSRNRALAIRVDGEGRPTTVLKIAGSQPGRAALAREGQALRWCAVSLPEKLAASVPTIIAESETPDTSVLALNAFDGRSQYVDLHADLRPARRFREHLRQAGEWLLEFHVATFRGPGDGIPLAASHGDFWPGNVLRNMEAEGSLAVVDWEAFDPVRPVTEDLLGYLTSYARAAPASGFRRLPPEQALRRALTGSGELAEAVAACLGRYCDALEIDRNALDDTLIDRVCREAPGSELCRRLRAEKPEGGTPGTRAGGAR